MKFILLILAIFAVFVSADCKTAAGKYSAVESQGLCSCTWYNDKNCCPSNGISSKGTYDSLAYSCDPDNSNRGRKAQVCPTETTGCSDALNLASCGASCSPKQSDFTDDLGAKTMCTEFLENWWKTCKNEQYWDDEDRECKKYSDKYSDEDEFFAGPGAQAGFDAHDSSDCWNASSFTAPGISLFLGMIGAFFGFRSPVLLLAVVAAVIPLASAKCYIAGSQDEGSTLKVDNMCGCDWYKDDTCDAMNAQQPYLYNSDKHCRKSSSYKRQYGCKEEWPSSCLDALDFSDCAKKYSPKNYEFHLDANGTNVNAGIWICEDQSKKAWDACKDAIVWNGAEEKCEKWSDIYDNSTQFATSVLQWSGERDENCWSPASTLFASVGLIFALALNFA